MLGDGPIRYVAIGDSFTEGVGDQTPGALPRGWADRVAQGLATHCPGPVFYANLAIRGRLLAPIVADQLPAALALEPAPTFLTLNGGGNDMLRPRADIDRLTALTRQVIEGCHGAGIKPVVLAGPDPSGGLPLARLIHRRAAELTAAAADLAAATDAFFINVFRDREIRRPGYWSEDRLHLNSAGHARVAALVLTALGIPAPLPARPANPSAGLSADLRFYRQHVGPWMGRRVRRRSSGDNRTAKYPAWTLQAPPPTAPAT
ncbi:MAG: SGNH/GDSL hydrolase family protein [Bifidobacteriaceae bacterium]|nr:SGNH/GDSL hydrolase family protein [Bifidobacteriaceae bacterium]